MNVSSVSRSVAMMLRAHGAKPGASNPKAAPTAPTVDQAREQLRAASTALAAAFRALARETMSVDRAAVFTTARAVAMLNAVRLDPTSAGSPISSSTSGLDVASREASRLYSAALGRDVTSAQTASARK
ncbi:MAG: hypothetical protein Q8S13_12125, partial [Dehalococcoidia bacterium]|nr:hypothetical protein [Dehalococcoidia bacterium]